MALFDTHTRAEIERIIDECDWRAGIKLRRITGRKEDSVTEHLVTSICKQIIEDLGESDSGLKVKIFSQKNPQNEEKAWGVDAILILYDHEQSAGKICLFEAKIDRDRWDEPEKKSKMSHFSSQLSRQKTPYNDGCVIWEQFYKGPASLPEGSKRSSTHSTCILHQDAVQHNGTHPNNKVWTVSDIDALARNYTVFRMGELIRKVCECLHGKLKNLDEILAFVRNMPIVENVLLIEKVSPELRNEIVVALTDRTYEELNEHFKTQKRRPFRP